MALLVLIVEPKASESSILNVIVEGKVLLDDLLKPMQKLVIPNVFF